MERVTQRRSKKIWFCDMVVLFRIYLISIEVVIVVVVAVWTVWTPLLIGRELHVSIDWTTWNFQI